MNELEALEIIKNAGLEEKDFQEIFGDDAKNISLEMKVKIAMLTGFRR